MNGGLPMQEGGQLLASSNMLVNKRTLITARSGDLGLPNGDVNTSVYGLFGGQGTNKVYVSELGEHCEINYHHPHPADDRGTVRLAFGCLPRMTGLCLQDTFLVLF